MNTSEKRQLSNKTKAHKILQNFAQRHEMGWRIKTGRRLDTTWKELHSNMYKNVQVVSGLTACTNWSLDKAPLRFNRRDLATELPVWLEKEREKHLLADIQADSIDDIIRLLLSEDNVKYPVRKNFPTLNYECENENHHRLSAQCASHQRLTETIQKLYNNSPCCNCLTAQFSTEDPTSHDITSEALSEPADESNVPFITLDTASEPKSLGKVSSRHTSVSRASNATQHLLHPTFIPRVSSPTVRHKSERQVDFQRSASYSDYSENAGKVKDMTNNAAIDTTHDTTRNSTARDEKINSNTSSEFETLGHNFIQEKINSQDQQNDTKLIQGLMSESTHLPMTSHVMDDAVPNEVAVNHKVLTISNILEYISNISLGMSNLGAVPTSDATSNHHEKRVDDSDHVAASKPTTINSTVLDVGKMISPQESIQTVDSVVEETTTSSINDVTTSALSAILAVEKHVTARTNEQPFGVQDNPIPADTSTQKELSVKSSTTDQVEGIGHHSLSTKETEYFEDTMTSTRFTSSSNYPMDTISSSYICNPSVTPLSIPNCASFDTCQKAGEVKPNCINIKQELPLSESNSVTDAATHNHTTAPDSQSSLSLDPESLLSSIKTVTAVEDLGRTPVYAGEEL